LGATVGEKGIVVASGFNALTSLSGVLFKAYTEVEEEREDCAREIIFHCFISMC
jgi:hypothetical protein